MFNKLKEIMEDRAEESETRMFLFGIFGLIAYLPYYLINQHLLTATQFDSFWLRVSIAILCLFLVLKNYWPMNLRKFLPIYWYLVLMYSMPFFLAYMTLMNHGATAWVMNLLAITILMMLLVDWVSYTILLVGGIFLAYIAFILATYGIFVYQPGVIGYHDIINTLIPTIIMGIIFSYDKERIEKEKISAMKLIAANLAHELRTPLAAIKASASATKDYLPDLINTYEIARKNKLD
ncbi:MAG TPA: histidine kinase dimerization/phospho-acceptor domain-containing protein, partial [Gammaproteobacteria bacterium]|nr:histidine kinase dimerization/phospho-acceptor domain-containing protein [Gammaproteobacteria bacterium]